MKRVNKTLTKLEIGSAINVGSGAVFVKIAGQDIINEAEILDKQSEIQNKILFIMKEAAEALAACCDNREEFEALIKNNVLNHNVKTIADFIPTLSDATDSKELDKVVKSNIIDGFADIKYLLEGAIISANIDNFDNFYDQIHQNNMTKFFITDSPNVYTDSEEKIQNFINYELANNSKKDKIAEITAVYTDTTAFVSLKDNQGYVIKPSSFKPIKVDGSKYFINSKK